MFLSCPTIFDGKHVVVLEDVTTTGGSSLQAVKQVREEGGIVEIILTIVGRMEGASEMLAGEGIRLVAPLTAGDF